VPGALLAIMPKCPARLAAYVLLLTGIGLSATTAGFVKMGLIGLCSVWLTYLALRGARRFVCRRKEQGIPHRPMRAAWIRSSVCAINSSEPPIRGAGGGSMSLPALDTPEDLG
jgi:hypothetical protein